MKWVRAEPAPSPVDYGARDSIEMVKAFLEPGEVYALRFTEIVAGTRGVPGSHTHRTVRRRYRLVRKYEHFALMENPYGIKEGFLYWELWKRITWPHA